MSVLIAAEFGLPGDDVRDALHRCGPESIHNAIRDARQVRSLNATQTLNRITATELALGDYSTNFLCDNVLVEGQPHIIAGGKKCLKTNLSLELAISLATETPFLGRFDVQRSVRVAFMSGESGLGTLQETAFRICKAKDLALEQLGDQIVFSDRLPQIASMNSLDEFAQYCVADRIEVAFIDPAYLCTDTGGNESSLFAVGKVLSGFAETCLNTGLTPVLVHHTKKHRTNSESGYFDPPELEDIAWSGFQEWARAWVLVGRRSPYEPGTGNHELWMSVGGSVGHSGLWGLNIEEGIFPNRIWSVELESAREVRAAAAELKINAKQDKQRKRIEERKNAIVKVMKKLPDGDTKSAIRNASSLGPSTFEAPWFELLGEGQIEQVDVKKHTRIEKGWKLVACSDMLGRARTSEQPAQASGGGRTSPL